MKKNSHDDSDANSVTMINESSSCRHRHKNMKDHVVLKAVNTITAALYAEGHNFRNALTVTYFEICQKRLPDHSRNLSKTTPKQAPLRDHSKTSP